MDSTGGNVARDDRNDFEVGPSSPSSKRLKELDRLIRSRPLGRMRTFSFWCLVLVATCLVGPYVFGVRPRRRRDWFALAIVIAFLIWLLPGLDSPLRSQ